MRKLLKRAAAAILIAACVVGLSACTANQGEEDGGPKIETEGSPVNESMALSLKSLAVQTLGGSMDQLVIQQTINELYGDTDSAALYGIQIDNRHKMGSIKSVDMGDAGVVLLKDGSYTVMIPVVFEKGTMEYVLNMNMITKKIKGEFTQVANSEDEGKSVGVMMETAGVYAAIGIGTVFVVLVFISLLIACFKYIHNWEKAKKAGKNNPAFDASPEPFHRADAQGTGQDPSHEVNTLGQDNSHRAGTLEAGQDVSDDKELVAVITAAIAAYEGTSSNGLVVRSIRRVKGSGRR